MKTKLCTVRKDILDRKERVPIGNGYYGESEPLQYRWSCDDDFHVFHEGKWKVAQSIDFDFENKPKRYTHKHDPFMACEVIDTTKDGVKVLLTQLVGREFKTTIQQYNKAEFESKWEVKNESSNV